MLIQTFPPRLIFRVIATRAASIWRLVIQPRSSAFSPYSPNATWLPPLVLPRRLPRICLRCLTRFGISISSRPPLRRAPAGCSAAGAAGASGRSGRLGRAPEPRQAAGVSAAGVGAAAAGAGRLRLGLWLRLRRPACAAAWQPPPPPRDRRPPWRHRRPLRRLRPGRRADRVLVLVLAGAEALGHDLAVVDPALDADAAGGGPGLGEAVVDVRAKGVQRHAAVGVALGPRHLGAAQAAGDLDLHALGARSASRRSARASSRGGRRRGSGAARRSTGRRASRPARGA